MFHVEGALGWELFSEIFLLEGTPIIRPPHTETDGIKELSSLQGKARKRTQRSFCLWSQRFQTIRERTALSSLSTPVWFLFCFV